VLADRVKAIKDADELAELRAAAGIADAAYDRVFAAARPDATAAELAAEAHGEARRRGARETLVFVSAGLYHGGPPSHVPLAPGDLLTTYVELAGPSGYWVEQVGMIALGELDDTRKRVARTVLTALAAGETRLRAGAAAGEPASAMDSVALDAGLGVGLCHGHGHGVGAGDEDPPRISPGDGSPLIAGMVAVLHPNVFDRAGAVSATAGSTYVVHTGAAERLSGIVPELRHAPI
jgi:Xaa-Pro aminopeptidase